MTTAAFWNFYNEVSVYVLIILGVVAILCLLKSVIGPKPSDRIIAVNMMGTVIMAMIVVLAVRLRESYLGDICLVYAMISFLAVIVLTKVYYGAYIARKKSREQEGQSDGNN